MQLSDLASLAKSGTVEEFKALLNNYGDKNGSERGFSRACIDGMVNAIAGSQDKAAKISVAIEYLGAKGNVVNIGVDEASHLAKLSTAEEFQTLLGVYGDKIGSDGCFRRAYIDCMVNAIVGSKDEAAKISAAINNLGATGVNLGLDEARILAKKSTAQDFQTLVDVYSDRRGKSGSCGGLYIDWMVNGIAGSKDEASKISAAIEYLGETGVNLGLDEALILAKKSTAQDFQTLLSVYGGRMGRSGSFSYPYIDYMTGAVTGNSPAAESAEKRALITDYTCKQGVFKVQPLPPAAPQFTAAATKEKKTRRNPLRFFRGARP